MSSDIVLWSSPNGKKLPVNIKEFKDLSIHIAALSPNEVTKIVSAFNADLYDMATEYTWRRTINILRAKVLSFGEEFVLEMLGRQDVETDSSDFLSEVDIINLSADLGLINKTGRLLFLQASESIHHFSSKDADEEMDAMTAQSCIRNCIKYVLSVSDDDYTFAFSSFRDSLKNDLFNEESSLYLSLISSPYFYKKTTVRTLLNLAKLSKGAELEKVLANMIFVLQKIWDDLLADDRWPIGFAYSEAVSEGNIVLVNALKKLLTKVKGFDYVPENLRSLTFIEAAHRLLRAHNSADNFYSEAPIAKELSSLGTSIPSPAIGPCMTAILASKLGNQYGEAWNAQGYLDDILKGITPSRWEYYFNNTFKGDETILYKLLESKPRSRWLELADNYSFVELNIQPSLVAKILDSSINKKIKELRISVEKLINTIR
jgi:hypothetical protein